MYSRDSGPVGLVSAAGGRTQRAAHLHRVEIDQRHVGGVGVDITNICKPQFDQWA